MNSKENLVFLGMMGSGKSSIGSLVSKKLNIDFIDVDVEIEKKIGLKISKIFEKQGEKYFRQVEEVETLKFLKSKKTVISLGGGAFLNNRIKKEVLDNHISFWLNWDNEILLNRIKDSKKRPLVSNSTNNELIDLIKKRSNIYSKALHEIKCDNLSKNEMVKRISEGEESAKITIIAYESLTCGHCANFHKDVYPGLKKDFIDKGLVKIEFRHFPLDLAAFNA